MSYLLGWLAVQLAYSMIAEKCISCSSRRSTLLSPITTSIPSSRISSHVSRQQHMCLPM